MSSTLDDEKRDSVITETEYYCGKRNSIRFLLRHFAWEGDKTHNHTSLWPIRLTSDCVDKITSCCDRSQKSSTRYHNVKLFKQLYGRQVHAENTLKLSTTNEKWKSMLSWPSRVLCWALSKTTRDINKLFRLVPNLSHSLIRIFQNLYGSRYHFQWKKPDCTLHFSRFFINHTEATTKKHWENTEARKILNAEKMKKWKKWT